MRKITTLILALSLFFVPAAFAAGYDGGYATVNSSSSGSGATACAGLSDAGTGCSTTVGTLATANAVSPPALGATTSSTAQFTRLCTGTSPCTLPATTGDAQFQRSTSTGAIFVGDAIIAEQLGLAGLVITAGGSANGALFNMRNFENFSITGTNAPAITVCGTGSPTASGNNSAFFITTGSGASTACTATFNVTNSTFANAPVCTLTDVGSNTAPFITSTSATVLVIGYTSTTSHVFNVHCIGH